MNAPYSLRRAGAEDAPVIAHHRAAMFRDMGEADEAATTIIENASEDHIAALIEAREYFGFLAEHEGVIVAGGGVWLRPVLPRPGALQGAMEAYILNVYTEPSHRRAGVARALMEMMIEWSRGQRVVRIVLHASREGQPLYTGLGFEATNEMRLLLKEGA